MSTFRIRILNTGEAFVCRDEDNVLKALEQLCRRGIPVGCRNGGCGVCKVRVASGDYGVRKMSRAVCSAQEEQEGRVLACKLYPHSDLELEVVGRMVRAIEAPIAQHGASSQSGFMAAALISQPDKET